MQLYSHRQKVLDETKDFNRVAYYLDMGLGKTFVGIEDATIKIRDLEYEDYDHENLHKAIDFYGELNKLKGCKEALITIKRIVENI